ncbi:MAG: cytochrome c [Desulfuromonadales bacterium]
MPMFSRVAVSLFSLLLVVACSDRGPSYPKVTPPDGYLQRAENQEEGRRIFRQLCAECHGRPSEGRSQRADFFYPPAPNFTSPLYRQADPAYLFWRIRKGKTVEPYLSRGSVMPAYGAHFSEEETWSIVAYLRVRSEVSSD